MPDKNRDMTLEEAERIVEEENKRNLIAQAKQIKSRQEVRSFFGGCGCLIVAS